MTRDWSPNEVVSKSCRNCSKMIYLDPAKRKFYNDPYFNEFHHCTAWSPRLQNNSEIVDQIRELKVDILQSITSLTREIADLRCAVRNS